ncbi:MAG: ParB/RepB/Spo0J family partition protein [Sulfuritalea sp.]|nr:ParB/RepB/Spo0J family partition protein [Sulfuritalea sp.]
MKKEDLAKQAHQTADSASRFERAEALLAVQPTGFASRTPPPSAIPGAAPMVAPLHSDDKRAGRFERVAIGLIDPNPYNARKIYRPQRIGELAQSLVANGQLQPGVGTFRNGRCILAAGHYRLAGIRQAALPVMDLMIHDGLTDRDLFEYSYRENAEREGQSALDDAMAWRYAIDQKIYGSETELAAAVQKSLAVVNRTLSILKLSPAIIDLVSQNPEAYPMSSLAELVLLETAGGTDVALAFAERLGLGEIGRTEITEARARFTAPKPRKEKETSRQYKLKMPDGTLAGVLKEWDSGRVSFDVVCTSAAERQALVDDLKKRFALGDE